MHRRPLSKKFPGFWFTKPSSVAVNETNWVCPGAMTRLIPTSVPLQTMPLEPLWLMLIPVLVSFCWPWARPNWTCQPAMNWLLVFLIPNVPVNVVALLWNVS